MVIDRTQADIDKAAEIINKIKNEGYTPTTEDLTVLERGTWNVDTINRIESKQAELATLLREYGYYVNIVNKTNWQKGEIFADHDRIIENLDKLKKAFFVYDDTPTTPTYIYYWQNANDVEKILVDIEKMINSMIPRFRECNTFQCGEVNLL